MSHRLDQAFERALAYLDQHLNEPFELQALADIAQIPRCHFDPLFIALYHMPIDAYVELLKSLEAAHLLGFGQQVSLVTIAAKLGYCNEQHFIESFTRSIGQSPESFQQAPDWGNFFAKQQPLKSFQADMSQQNKPSNSVEIVSFDAQALAVMEHHGDSALLPQTIATFIDWRRQHGLSPHGCRTFNLLYSTPELSVKTQYRIDIGVSLNTETQAKLNPLASELSQIKFKSIPQGRCAMIKYSGDDNGIAAVITYLYRDWVNANDVTLRDFPVYLERLDIGENEFANHEPIQPVYPQHMFIYLPIV
ncbi:GyrI-like domain-containing protein [Shewanella sp. MEBiC00475]|uniref:AraC family transcriptional regulator n=1 Tax=Shewanella sp. MEBiC00475 TaxID=2575361 RepID=UPI0010C08EF9|nr:GyrI-like domain-containing protein [Shewanella sp. MEBiC00475]